MRFITRFLYISLLIILTFCSCERREYANVYIPESIQTEHSSSNSYTSTLHQQDSLRLEAKIVGIQDGDTVEALYNGELLLKVRLAHIDAPEKRKSQPFGKASKQALSDLCFGQTVTLVSKGQGERDRYGRLIAVIINEKKVNCNRQMVRLGMAWHFRKYSENEIYAELENKARTDKVGLWRDPNAIAPWAWRKR